MADFKPDDQKPQDSNSQDKKQDDTLANAKYFAKLHADTDHLLKDLSVVLYLTRLLKGLDNDCVELLTDPDVHDRHKILTEIREHIVSFSQSTNTLTSQISPLTRVALKRIRKNKPIPTQFFDTKLHSDVVQKTLANLTKIAQAIRDDLTKFLKILDDDNSIIIFESYQMAVNRFLTDVAPTKPQLLCQLVALDYIAAQTTNAANRIFD